MMQVKTVEQLNKRIELVRATQKEFSGFNQN